MNVGSRSARFRGPHIHFSAIGQGVQVQTCIPKRTVTASFIEIPTINFLHAGFLFGDKWFFLFFDFVPNFTRINILGMSSALWTSFGHVEIKLFALTPFSDARETETMHTIGQNTESLFSDLGFFHHRIETDAAGHGAYNWAGFCERAGARSWRCVWRSGGRCGFGRR